MTSTPTPRAITTIITDDGETWSPIRTSDGAQAMDDEGLALMKRARDGRVRTYDAGGE